MLSVATQRITSFTSRLVFSDIRAPAATDNVYTLVIIGVIGFMATAIPIQMSAHFFLSLDALGNRFELSWIPLALMIALVLYERNLILGPWKWFYIVLALSFIIGLIVGLVKSNNRHEMLRDIVGLSPLLSFLLSISIIRSAARARSAIIGLTSGLIAYSLFLFVLAVAHVPRVSEEQDRYWFGAPRLYFHNSYLLAGFAGAFVAAGLSSHRRERYVMLGGASLLAIAALASNTKQVIAWTILALILGYFLPQRSSESGFWRRRTIVILTPFLVIALAISSLLAVKYLSTREERDTPSNAAKAVDSGKARSYDQQMRDASGRLKSWRLAWDKDKNALPLGDGIGTLFPNQWSSPGYNRARTQGFQPGVDNLPLTVLGKLGVIGLIAFGVLFVVMIALANCAWRRFHNSQISSIEAISLAAIAISTPTLLLLSVGQSFFFNSQVVIAVGLVYAAGLQVLRSAPRPAQEGFERNELSTISQERTSGFDIRWHH